MPAKPKPKSKPAAKAAPKKPVAKAVPKQKPLVIKEPVVIKSVAARKDSGLSSVAKPLPAKNALELANVAVAAVEAKLDELGTQHGEAAILELRNEFDKVKHHEPWRKLFAIARFAQEAK